MSRRAGIQAEYDRRNLETARLILQDPVKHGGEQALLVRWARLVLMREATERAGDVATGEAA